MECPVCVEPYDLERRRPKVLVPCGHCVCLQCLLHPSFGKACPQDRKPFRGKPAQLPDCMAIINLIGQGGASPARPAPWCRDCNADFSDNCVDEGHTPCSRKKMRTEQVAPQVQALERGVTASAALGQHLEAVKQDVQVKMNERNADEAQLREALASLKAATEVQTSMKPAIDAAEPLLPLAERLEESASLAGLRGRCSVVVQAQDGAEWRASVAMEDGKRCALRQGLVNLHQLGELSKVDVVGQTLSLSNRRPSSMSAEEKIKLLQRGTLEQVRSLTGVDCARDPQFCELLLQAVGPHLEELEMENPGMQHTEALKAMPLLRKLSVTNTNPEEAVAAVSQFPASLQELCIKPATVEHMWLVQDLKALRKLDVACQSYWATPVPNLNLPLQLEELTLKRCSKQHLSSIQRMSRLRRLCVNGLANHAKDFRFPLLLPTLHCGLSWLELATPREAPVLSLIRAHAATLQEIRLLHSSSVGHSPYIRGLPGCFRDSVFPNLQRLVLMRRPYDNQWWTPEHSVESCLLQVRELRDALRSGGGDVAMDVADGVGTVSVLCDTCDVLPL